MRQDHESTLTSVERSVVLDAIRASKHRALLRHDEHVEDCSSIGGSHAFFAVLSPGGGTAYCGGRGTRLPRLERGAYFVAAVQPLPAPRSTKDAYACVPGRTVHAGVEALVPVGSAEDGAKLLEDLAHR